MIHPNDYRYDIYEGPHRIGRRYRQKKDAVRFASKQGPNWYVVTVLPIPAEGRERVVTVADYLGRMLDPRDTAIPND